MTMKQRQLGGNGPDVGELGLGCMGMSDFYGPADRRESLATLDAALDSGANLIDTGDFYGSGHNEMLIAEALKGRRREDYLLSVKFGALRDADVAKGGVGAALAAAPAGTAAARTILFGAEYVVDAGRTARRGGVIATGQPRVARAFWRGGGGRDFACWGSIAGRIAAPGFIAAACAIIGGGALHAHQNLRALLRQPLAKMLHGLSIGTPAPQKQCLMSLFRACRRFGGAQKRLGRRLMQCEGAVCHE